jgi:cell division protein FtsZ
VNTAAELVQKSVDPDANIIVGAVIDENLKDEIIITVIATGFDKTPVINKKEKTPEKNTVSSINKVQAPDVSEDELDIPTFLRRNRFQSKT